MPASKSVVIGLSVSGAVALITLAIVLALMYTPRGEKPSAQCGAAPTVDTTTGKVTNFGNMLKPDGTCGENVEGLNKLCLETWCHSPAIPACTPPRASSWSQYDAKSHTCVVIPDPPCEAQLCDAPYCTSPSVQHLLPPIHKQATVAKTCANLSESEVAAMCNALPNYQYSGGECRAVGMEKVIDVKVATANTTHLSGTLCFPAAPETKIVVFRLEGAAGVVSGPVSLSLATDGCVQFDIQMLPGALRAGTYTLMFEGRESWQDAFTVESKQPVAVTLVDEVPTDPSVKPSLNAVPSRELATTLTSSPETLRLLVTAATASLPGAVVPPDLSKDTALILPTSPNTGVGTQTTSLLMACAPPLCPLEGDTSKLMKHAIVLIAWPPVTPVTVEGVNYLVTKRTVTDTTVTPVTLPTAVVIADLVSVGEVASYTITTTNGTLRSQPVTLSLYVSPFTDSVCHSVVIHPGASVKPPWMWSSPSGCVWYPDYYPAGDYYCLFESGGTQPSLMDSNNVCQPLQATPPDVVLWSDEYCSEADSAANNKAACFTGYNDKKGRRVTCSKAVKLGTGGDSISNEQAFFDRLNDVVSFYNAHNISDSAFIHTIDTTAGQAALYNTITQCGPRGDSMWGTLRTSCPGNDEQCLQAVTNARCGTAEGDRNVCQPWQLLDDTTGRETYTQTRICFGSPTFTNSSCCQSGQKYVFDNQAPLTSARGRCE